MFPNEAARESWPLPTKDAYAYARFERRYFLEGLFFQGGPAPGERLPDFCLTDLHGRSVKKYDLLGKRPVIFIFGSATCPMTQSGLPIWKELFCRHGRQVQFVTVYDREAHPGEWLPQPLTLEEKIHRARLLQERAQIPWPVLVDDVSGALHRALGGAPNTVYFMSSQGTVCFRALASNQKWLMEKAVEALSRQGDPLLGERRNRVIPSLRAVGVIHQTLAPAGSQALSDLKRELPWFYLPVELARAFKPLPPLLRGCAAFALPFFFLTGLPFWLQHREG